MPLAGVRELPWESAPPSSGAVVVPFCPLGEVVFFFPAPRLADACGDREELRGLAAAHLAGEHEALSGDFFALLRGRFFVRRLGLPMRVRIERNGAALRRRDFFALCPYCSFRVRVLWGRGSPFLFLFLFLCTEII